MTQHGSDPSLSADPDRAGEQSERRGEEPSVVLRRVERFIIVYGLAGVVFWLVVLGGWIEALILTLTAAASIVSFRGLQRLVGSLAVGEGGKLSRRSKVSAGVRFATVLLLPAVSLWLNSRQVLALIVGFSSLPFALMTEAAWEFFGRSKSESTDGN